MNALLDQLGLDSSFFVQLVIIALVFVVLSNVYFRPFLKLFEERHRRTVEDRKEAETLLLQANEKFEEYQCILRAERAAARAELELALSKAREVEAELLGAAREKAKQMAQEAAESIQIQRIQLKAQLDKDVEQFAMSVSQQLLTRKNMGKSDEAK